MVIGSGNSAAQAALFLGRRAARVHLVVRGPSRAASMSDDLIERIRKNPAITLHFHAEITALHGEEVLDAVTLRYRASETRLPAAGLFIMVGAAPNTDWLADLVDLDARGFVRTDDGHAAATPGILTPGILTPGISAVGDVRAGSVKRVASAVGEGSVVISRVWEPVAAADRG